MGVGDVYLVLINGKTWGTLSWQKYRLMLTKNDGGEHLFHRSVALRKAREAIARSTGNPIGAIKVVKQCESEHQNDDGKGAA